MARPLYMMISDSLRQGLLSGEYKPGDMLPSEHVLAARFETSRITVRKSLNILENEGLVRPWHGKGYFVLPPQYTTFTLYFGDNTVDGRFRFQEVTMLRPPKDVAGALQMGKHQLAIVTRRILEREGRNVAYDEKFIPYERGVPSIEFELHYAEFPHMFEERFAPISLRTEMTIGMEQSPEHVSLALGLPDGAPLLVVGRLICAGEDHPAGKSAGKPADKPVGYGRQYLTEAFGKLTARSGYYTQDKL